MLRSGSLLVLVAGLALSLDLDAIQRTSHFPASGPASYQGQQRSFRGASKRTSVLRRDPEELHGRHLVAAAGSASPEERLYYRLLSSRMARLLPALLGENQQQRHPSGQAALVPTFFDDDDDSSDDAVGHSASRGGSLADEDAGEEDEGDEQETDEVMMYLPKRRVVHSSAPSIRRGLQQPSFDVDPSAPVYGVRRRVPAFKRGIHVNVRREEKRKRSAHRQLREGQLFRLKTTKKAVDKKPAGFALRQRKTSTATPYLLGQKGSGKSSVVPKEAANATSHKPDPQAEGKTVDGSTSNGGSNKYHIMKRSSFSTDDKVTGELRNIFGNDVDEDKQHDRKTLKKRENAAANLKGSSAADDEHGAGSVVNDGSSSASKGGTSHSTEEDKFKKWLLDEYYRTMALSFASMRRKRMATHQDTLDLRQVKRTTASSSAPRAETADEQFQAVEDKLRTIEDAMIGEAVMLVRDGAGDEAALQAINAGVASRLDAAYDLENVRKSLGHLQSTMENMRRDELQVALAAEEDEGDENDHSAFLATPGVFRKNMADVEEMAQDSSWSQVIEQRNCPAVQMLSSSCPAAAQLFTPVRAVQRLLLEACQRQQICFVCGSYYGLGAEGCDGGPSGGGASSSGSNQFSRLLVSQLLLRQAKHSQAQNACAEACVADFLLNH